MLAVYSDSFFFPAFDRETRHTFIVTIKETKSQ